MQILALLALLTPLSIDLEGSDDWPTWRGPDGNSVSSGTPPIQFGEEDNLKWKAALPGKGLSTPIIVGGRVFVTTAVSAEPEAGGSGSSRGSTGGGRGRGRGRSAPLSETDFLVIAFDRQDGSVVWEQIARTQVPHQGTHRDGSFASPSVVSDGERLFASFGSYGLYAYDLEGELLWELDLGDMNIANSFGEGSSPILWGDSLILAWDHDGDSFLVALDKKTGKEIWRTEREQGTNWGSPLVATGAKGQAQIIVASSTTIAYDAKTGAEIWSCGAGGSASAGSGDGSPEGRGGNRAGNRGGGRAGGRGGARRGGIIATPVLHDGLLVYSTGTRSGGSFHALRVADAEGTKVEASDAMVWKRDRDAPRIPSPIVHDGILYALKGSSGLLSALDFESGEPLYTSKRLDAVGDVWATPVIAGEHIYILGRDGTVEVVTTGTEMETVSVNKLEDVFDASPAVAGDELFIRGRSNLYCFAKSE